MADFSNISILSEDLPKAEILEFSPLEPLALKVWRVYLSLFFLLALLGESAFFYFIVDWTFLWLMITALLGLCFILAWLNQSYSFYWSGYALREQDLFYRSGWIRRRIRTVPIKRVQHMSVVSGWLERRYGLASLRIYTAAQSDFSIRGISQDRAQSLKAWISQQVDLEENTSDPIVPKNTEDAKDN